MKTTRSESGWQCPECGRRFKQRTREHSCDVRTLESHLVKSGPEVRATFERIRRVLDRLGAYSLVPVKTMVVFKAASNFGGIVLKRAHLDLGFFLARPLVNPRVCRSERISPRKFAHHVRLSVPDEVDSEIAAWMREAYRVNTAGEGESLTS